MLLFGCMGSLFPRRQVEWEAASSLIEGICLTLQRQPIISFLPHLRSLINVCVNLVREANAAWCTRGVTCRSSEHLCVRVFQVMGVVGPSSVADGLPLLHLSPYLSPPLPFSTAVVRLVALQIQVRSRSRFSNVFNPFYLQQGGYVLPGVYFG